MRHILPSVLCLLLICPAAPASAEDDNRRRKERVFPNKVIEVESAGKFACVYRRNRFRPLQVKQLKSGKYRTLKATKKLRKRKAYKRNKRRALRTCKGLNNEESRPKRIRDILSIPGNSEIFALLEPAVEAIGGRTRKVSGTPPFIHELSTADAGEKFWSEDFLDDFTSGVPDDEECESFWGSTTDGGHAGYLGCRLAESFGVAFNEIDAADLSRCYLQAGFKLNSEKSGTVTTVRTDRKHLYYSSFPRDYLTPHVFYSDPNIIRLNVDLSGLDESGSDTIYMQVESRKTNRKRKNDYEISFFFTGDPKSPAHGYENIKAKWNGQVTGVYKSIAEDESLQINYDGKLFFSYFDTKTFYFSPALPKNVSVALLTDETNYKMQANVVNGRLTLRVREETEVDEGLELMESYAKFDFGSANQGPHNQKIRLKGGAFRQRLSLDGELVHEGVHAMEWRDTAFVSSPDTAYASEMESYSFDTDSFFDSEAKEVTSIPAFDSEKWATNVHAELRYNTNKGRYTYICNDKAGGTPYYFCEQSDVILAERQYQRYCEE